MQVYDVANNFLEQVRPVILSGHKVKPFKFISVKF
jgi:hypothetical protein